MKNYLRAILLILLGVLLGLLSPYLFKTLKPSSTMTGHRDLEMKINFSLKDIQDPRGEIMIWKTVIPPQQKNSPGIAMHRHTDPRIVIPLTEGVLQRRDKDGSTTDYILNIGKPIFLPEDTLTGFHTDENLSNQPIALMVLQFKDLSMFNIEPLMPTDVQTVVIKPE